MSSGKLYSEKSASAVSVRAPEAADADAGVPEVLYTDGGVVIGEKGENGAGVTYQSASGAPVEARSPLGYAVGTWTALFLNVSMIVGTGIFSTREYVVPSAACFPWCVVEVMWRAATAGPAGGREVPAELSCALDGGKVRTPNLALGRVAHPDTRNGQCADCAASSILQSTGSIGLSLVYWAIGFVLTLSGLSVYLELLSYFPSRSGAEVVYLEQAFPRPRFFFPVAFAVQTIILSFTSGNAIVLATWIFRLCGATGSEWALKGTAIGAFAAISLVPVLSTRASLAAVNVFGAVKLLTLVFIAVAGFVVLGGRAGIPDPTGNFRNAFAGTRSDGYAQANALVSIIYSYQGFQNTFNLANEVRDPVRTLRRASNAAVLVVAVLYTLVNVAYFAAIPKRELEASAQVTATLFFERLFGARAAQGLTILPVLSAVGNILAVVVGQARIIREIGRQGVLPWNRWWVNIRPFGTPVGPIVTIWLVTTVMILAPPAGDAFNFVVALQNYPESAFFALMTVGLFVIRRKRASLGLPRSEYRAWTASVLLFLASKIYLLIMPWVPPADGINASSFHFFYATPSIVGLAM